MGGGGQNAVNRMIEEGIQGVEFIAVNTDAQALRNSSANTTLQIGGGITKGLGAGANPEVGRDAAMEDREALRELLTQRVLQAPTAAAREFSDLPPICSVEPDKGENLF